MEKFDRYLVERGEIENKKDLLSSLISLSCHNKRADFSYSSVIQVEISHPFVEMAKFENLKCFL